jgi:hypothetical protein
VLGPWPSSGKMGWIWWWPETMCKVALCMFMYKIQTIHERDKIDHAWNQSPSCGLLLGSVSPQFTVVQRGEAQEPWIWMCVNHCLLPRLEDVLTCWVDHHFPH